jgi:hypothetical protein
MLANYSWSFASDYDRPNISHAIMRPFLNLQSAGRLDPIGAVPDWLQVGI